MGSIVKVRIEVTEKGEITLQPQEVEVQVDQELEWVSEDGLHFAIAFDGSPRQPFRKTIFHKRFPSGRPIVGSGGPPHRYRVHVREIEVDGFVSIVASLAENPDLPPLEWREA